MPRRKVFVGKHVRFAVADLQHSIYYVALFFLQKIILIDLLATSIWRSFDVASDKCNDI